jgi:hypothetical protein
VCTLAVPTPVHASQLYWCNQTSLLVDSDALVYTVVADAIAALDKDLWLQDVDLTDSDGVAVGLFAIVDDLYEQFVDGDPEGPGRIEIIVSAALTHAYAADVSVSSINQPATLASLHPDWRLRSIKKFLITSRH